MIIVAVLSPLAPCSGHLEHRLGANGGAPPPPRPHTLNTVTAGCHVAPEGKYINYQQ